MYTFHFTGLEFKVYNKSWYINNNFITIRSPNTSIYRTLCIIFLHRYLRFFALKCKSIVHRAAGKYFHGLYAKLANNVCILGHCSSFTVFYIFDQSSMNYEIMFNDARIFINKTYTKRKTPSVIHLHNIILN